MNRNNSSYKPSRRSSSAKSSGGGGLLVGIIIGIIIGVSLAVLMAMYLSKAKTPFVNMEKFKDNARQKISSTVHETLAPSTKIVDASEQQATQKLPPLKEINDHANAVDSQKQASAAVADKNSAKAPEFDFYKILPGKSAADQVSKNQNTASATPVKSAYLQVGAFKKAADAEKLKAELALLGITAKIHSANTSTGLINRVIVGPYAHNDELELMRKQLKQNGFSASIN